MPDPKTPDPKTPPEDEADKDAELEARIAKVANSAVTAQLKRELPKHLDAFKGDLSKLLDERLPKAKVDGDGKGADDANKGAQGNAAKADPELLRMKEQLEKLQKQSAESEARAKAAEERSRREKTETALRSELVERHGLRPEHADAVVTTWLAKGVVKFNDDGEPVLTVRRARSKGAREEELEFDLANGVADWAKSEGAKPWLPAAGAQTSARQTGPRGLGARQSGPSTGGTQGKAGAGPDLSSLSEHELFGD